MRLFVFTVDAHERHPALQHRSLHERGAHGLSIYFHCRPHGRHLKSAAPHSQPQLCVTFALATWFVYRVSVNFHPSGRKTTYLLTQNSVITSV